MIRSALEYLGEMGQQLSNLKKTFVEVDDRKYWASDKREIVEPVQSRFDFETLTGLVDYVKDATDYSGNGIIHVAGYNEVAFRSHPFGSFEQRICYAISRYDRKGFSFNEFMDLEKFMIGLQVNFVQDEKHMGPVLGTLGNIVDKEITEHTDDGVSQKVNLRKGVHLASQEAVPRIIMLAPHRTFSEIEPMLLPFVLRLRKSRDGELQAALFDSGDLWKLWYTEKIKEYLKGRNLPEDIPVYG